MPHRDEYPPWVGLVYIFNLIVGTGALTLPAAFAGAGWLFSMFLLMFLAFVSFVTVTFVIESMACANATIQWRRIQSHKIDESEVPVDTDSENDNTTEETAILRVNRRHRYYSINSKVELGEIAALYLNKCGHMLFFVSLCVYLFGDLAIYTAASGKTLVDLSCKNSNDTENFTVKCWDSYDLTKMDVYRMFVALFALLVGPFTYFNVQKTKYLQFFTISIRWVAFLVMVTLASVRLIKYGQEGYPGLVNLREVPALAGSSVYSFMCHHSLPALMAPISNKQNIMRKVSFDFFLICSFYLLLCMTGSFAFEHLDVLYSLNFIHTEASSFVMKAIGFFLAAFPLFPMSTSFPIIAITLQSNLKNFILDQTVDRRRNFFVNRLLFPTLAVVPPVLVALCTHNLKRLVEITGTYAGVVVQYVVPAILVLYARRRCVKDFGSSSHSYASPFKHVSWFLFVIVWSVICIIFVTVDFILNGV
ncbi:hypothetical protein NQ315_006212 [Exocentrus adspersus]|uniref:Amino acid transporter transmembrane domain-containing protein n=1 Tax=Exocentrus adspersus TaxID=1586481 RepID=A0AAV8VZL2_9CUCU|nr:hypothetical protein NQ315_006212 [Exocentrus adspersus]